MLGLLGEVYPAFVAKLQSRPSCRPEYILDPASEREIAKLESVVGLRIPASYKRFLGATRGFWLFGGAVQFSNRHPFVHHFPSLDELTPRQRRVVRAKGGAWPPPSHGMLCFAEYFLQADGDQVLFDVSVGLVDDEYPVLYYSHDSRPPSIRRVAANFAEWLENRCLDDMT